MKTLKLNLLFFLLLLLSCTTKENNKIVIPSNSVPSLVSLEHSYNGTSYEVFHMEGTSETIFGKDQSSIRTVAEGTGFSEYASIDITITFPGEIERIEDAQELWYGEMEFPPCGIEMKFNRSSYKNKTNINPETLHLYTIYAAVKDQGSIFEYEGHKCFQLYYDLYWYAETPLNLGSSGRVSTIFCK